MMRVKTSRAFALTLNIVAARGRGTKVGRGGRSGVTAGATDHGEAGEEDATGGGGGGEGDGGGGGGVAVEFEDRRGGRVIDREGVSVRRRLARGGVSNCPEGLATGVACDI